MVISTHFVSPPGTLSAQYFQRPTLTLAPAISVVSQYGDAKPMSWKITAQKVNTNQTKRNLVASILFSIRIRIKHLLQSY